MRFSRPRFPSRHITSRYHRPYGGASIGRHAALHKSHAEHEGADHFLASGLSPMQDLHVELAAERRSRTAPTFSAGMVAAAARGRRLSGGQVERGNMRSGW